MKVNIYAYKDVQVGAFQQPFFRTDDEEITRISVARTVTVMSPEEAEKAHVRDLDLFKLGHLDDETGVIYSDVKFLLHLDQFVKKGEVNNDKSIQVKSTEAA